MKRLLSLVLALAMICCLAGATAEEKDYKAIYQDRTDYVVNNFASWAEENGLTKYLTPYDEPTTVTMVHGYSTAVENMMEKLGERYGETYNTNRWTDILSRCLNIEVKYDWWTHDNDYSTKLRLTAADQDLPDVFVVTDQSDVAQLAEAGQIIPLNDLIENEALPEVKDRWFADGGLTLSMVTIDGQIYGYPQTLSHTDDAAYVFIRSDWMEELGISFPETIEDVWDICYKFVESGKAKYGLHMETGDNAMWDYLCGVCEAYYAYPESWIVTEEGKLAYGPTQPNMKKALAQLQKMFKDGLIDPEFATKTATVAYENVINGNIGVCLGPHWFMTDIMSLYELQPGVTWYALPIHDSEGKIVPEAIRTNNRGFVCVNAKCKNPEIAFKMINLYHYAAYYSNDPTWWGYEESNSRVFAPVYSTVKPTDNLETYRNLKECFAAGNDTSLLRNKAVAYYGNITSDDYKKAWSWNQMFGTWEYTPMEVLEYLSDNGLLFYNAYVGAPSITYQDYWSTLQDLTKQMIIKIIMGADVDSTFDSYVEQWNATGGKTITEEANAWYQAQQAK